MAWRDRIANLKWFRKLLASPPDTTILRERPSRRFLFGVSLVGLSYLMCWPVIIALGWVSVYYKQPLIVGVGGPVVYGMSHCTFLLGMYFAGPDCLKCSRVLLRLLAYRFWKRVLRYEPGRDE